MKVQEAYEQWSATYDTDENFTRDLDRLVTREALVDLRCKTILEIGCGTGKNTSLLTMVAEKVHAFDISHAMLEKAKQKIGSSKVTFSIADISNYWPCTGKCIDLVVCNLVLEHVEDLEPVFSEASRSLVAGGRLFVCEYHPLQQYQGKKAQFETNEGTIEIQAFVHHISDFLEAATTNGLSLVDRGEWWHKADQNQPPRLVSFMFEK